MGGGRTFWFMPLPDFMLATALPFWGAHNLTYLLAPRQPKKDLPW